VLEGSLCEVLDIYLAGEKRPFAAGPNRASSAKK
jgi:hypothetical protein